MFRINFFDVDKSQSLIIKGFAILIMIFHHFYGLYAIPDSKGIMEELSSDSVFCLFHFCAKYGKICVLLFAFVTGYGYYIIMKKDRSSIFVSTCKRLQSFYPFFVFFVGGVYLTMYIFPSYINLTLKKAILQCCGVSYIPDYWYIAVVLAGALFYFPILLYSQRKNEIWHVSCFLLLMVINHFSYPLYYVLTKNCAAGSLFARIPVQDVSLAMPYLLLGYACRYIFENHHNIKNALIVGLPAILNAYLFSWDSRYVFLIVSILFVVQLNCIKKTMIAPVLVMFGQYSACMWLNHRLVFGYWFSDVFYSIPNPINYLILVAISFLLSIVITKIWISFKSLWNVLLAKH